MRSASAVLPLPWAAWRLFPFAGVSSAVLALAFVLARSERYGGVGLSFDYLLIYARFTHD